VCSSVVSAIGRHARGRRGRLRIPWPALRRGGRLHPSAFAEELPERHRVRAFPLVERGPFVWAWLGESAPDLTRIPATPWLDGADWVSSRGYFHLPANYVSLHENLLDLTHLSYVHARSFGTPDYAGAPCESNLEEGRYRITRTVMPTKLPPVWAKPTGLEHNAAARIATSEFVTPGLHVVTLTSSHA